MRIVCITLADAFAQAAKSDARFERIREHFVERGITADFFVGFHATRLGLQTKLTYEKDNPDSGYVMGPARVGCWLSHRALWSALMLTPDDVFFVLEDDAQLPPDWCARIDQVLADAPPHWDVIYVGSCCTEDKPKTHVAGALWEVKYPMCTHAMLLRRKALPMLIATTDEAGCYAPIDISLYFRSLPRLATYTVLPRIADQFATFIHP